MGGYFLGSPSSIASFDHVSASDDFLSEWLISGEESWLQPEEQIEAVPAEPQIEAVPEVEAAPAEPEIEAVPAKPEIEAAPEVEAVPAEPEIEAAPEVEAVPAELEMEAAPEVEAVPAEPEIEAVPEVVEAPPEAEIQAAPEVVEAPPAEQQPAVNPAGKRKRGSGKKKRGCKKQPYSGWWGRVSNPALSSDSESEFRSMLHMSRSTFNNLCAELSEAMAKNDTPAREAIPVPARVAVCLMRLAQGYPFRKIADHFDMGVSTAHKLVAQFCAAVRAVLRDRYVVWPSAPGNEIYAAVAKAKFEDLTGIPGVTGAVYTTHLPTIAPQVHVMSYYNPRHTERNEKGNPSYTVIFQGTVDANGAFTDVFLGSDGPDCSTGGSKSDEDVLLKSGLNHNSVEPFRLLGGASYPLTDYLLVPYSSSSSDGLTRAQEELNRGVEAGSAVAKDAFMKLKARWGFLQKRTEVKVADLRLIFETCCVLHNFCERSGDEFDPALAFELEDDEVPPEVPVRSAAAEQERDAIAHSLLLRRANDDGAVHGAFFD